MTFKSFMKTAGSVSVGVLNAWAEQERITAQDIAKAELDKVIADYALAKATSRGFMSYRDSRYHEALFSAAYAKAMREKVDLSQYRTVLSLNV